MAISAPVRCTANSTSDSVALLDLIASRPSRKETSTGSLAGRSPNSFRSSREIGLNQARLRCRHRKIIENDTGHRRPRLEQANSQALHFFPIHGLTAQPVAGDCDGKVHDQAVRSGEHLAFRNDPVAGVDFNLN